jgi:hypothetical protein
MEAWTGLWLRIGTGGGHVWMRWWTFEFHKMWGISWLAENRLVPQGGLCCMKWVSVCDQPFTFHTLSFPETLQKPHLLTSIINNFKSARNSFLNLENPSINKKTKSKVRLIK